MKWEARMPMRKEIPTLQDLSIDSVTRNIVRHGEAFKKCRRDGKLYVQYKVMQFLFTNDILERLLKIFYEEKYIASDLMGIKQLLFERKELRNPVECPGLQLLFNEYTTVFFPSFENAGGIGKEMSKSVLKYVVSECKNIKKLNNTFCSLARRRLCKMLPQLQNLREVEIKGITNTEILSQILQRCLFIRKLKADEVPFKATDEFLFSLCKHCSERKTFVLCPQNGKCLKAGKYLESLEIIGFSRYGLGIACALQHLPVLKTLDTFEFRYNGDEPDIITGITTLQNALIDTGMPPLTLQLTALHFLSSFTLKELQMVFVSCPKLESVQIDFIYFDQEIFSILPCSNLKQMNLWSASNRVLSSMELKQFLAEHGNQITVLKLMKSQEPLDLTYVNNILDYCCNLEDLCVWYIDVYDRSYTHLRCSPISRANLKKITLLSHEIPQSARDYFSKLLCDAENLRKLSISKLHAEEGFLHALEKHRFRDLEELCMLFCEITIILMETLLCTCRNLKKIKIVEGPCSSVDDMYLKNNCALEISFISDFCKPPYLSERQSIREVPYILGRLTK